MRHPADGLYYLDLEMLRKAGACHGQTEEFKALFGERVTATLDNVLYAYSHFTPHLTVLSGFMEAAGHITQREDEAFEMNYYGAIRPWKRNWKTLVARAFMDLLEVRAKREGLIQK